MLLSGLRILYLHGFASGPNSRKARFFSEQFQKLGLNMEIPDLAEGDFERLTISAQLRLLEQLCANQPVILLGSSLGGYVAGLYAARHPEVSRLILLAPALGCSQLWEDRLGEDGLAQWRETGSMAVFHYAEGRNMPIRYQFIEDARQFEAFPDFYQPGLIFHGNHDPVVPVIQSAEFVEHHRNVRLVRLESGHELTDVLDIIWAESQDFLFKDAPYKQ